MTIANHNASNVGAPLQLFSSHTMTAAGGTPPTGYSRGNFGIMTPDTVEGFDWELMQTPITPGFIGVNIRNLTDLGPDYWKEIRYLQSGNDPNWQGFVLKSEDVTTYFHIGGISTWTFTAGAPGFYIQGSLYPFEMFR